MDQVINEDLFGEENAIPTDELKYYGERGITFDQHLGADVFSTVWLVSRANFNTGLSKQLACKVSQIVALGSPPQISFWVAGKELPLKTAAEFLTWEGEVLRKLNHQNVVRMSPMFNIHKKVRYYPYVRILLFIELPDGDLNSMIMESPDQKLKEPVLLDMMKQVSEGLRYLHDQDLCHFDIKPQNIWYYNQPEGHTIFKLGDFGLAKRILPDTTDPKDTVIYIPPEGYADKPMDVYALGMVLAFALTGRVESQIIFVNWIRNDWDTQRDEIAHHYKVSPLCVEVIRIMSEMDPSKRATIGEVCTHQWITGRTQQQSDDPYQAMYNEFEQSFLQLQWPE